VRGVVLRPASIAAPEPHTPAPPAPPQVGWTVRTVVVDVEP
jgi:hypothetical protein